jgi:hypothetical protein
MRILPAIEEEIRRVVRDARATDPLIRVAGLKAVLEKHFDRGFSHQYVSKIADKVAREGLMELDRTKIEERIQFTRENYRMMRERLLKIIYWQPDPDLDIKFQRAPYHEDVIDAAKTLVMLDLALFKAELEVGMYKKPLADIAKEIHYEPLPPDVRAVVIASWRNFGLLPPATIERMVPAKHDVQQAHQ